MFGRKKLLARIEALETQVRYLENMHATIRPAITWETPVIHLDRDWKDKLKRVGRYNGRQLTEAEVKFQPSHPQFKQTTVETDRISKVTLEELARLVIDGTPIRREEKVVSKRVSEYTEDSTTRITILE
jgi:hypothetical protein